MDEQANRTGAPGRWGRALRAGLAGLLAVGVAATSATTATAAELSLRSDEYVIFHHHDALGSPAVTTGADGEALWFEYTEPFGRSQGRRDASNAQLDDDLTGQFEEDGFARPGYTGHVRDGASGLVYMQARHYDPELGRFLSIDPVGFTPSNPTSFNRYAYANNNPYGYIDPDGRFAFGLVAKGVKLAIKGGDVAATFGGMATDARTIFSGSASLASRIAAAGSLITEVASPVSARDAKAAAAAIEEAVDQAGKAAKAADRSLGSNPFSGKSRDEIADMLEKKGYKPRPNASGARGGRGTYVNPRTGRGYHIDADHPEPKGPHVGVNRPRDKRDTMNDRDYSTEQDTE